MTSSERTKMIERVVDVLKQFDLDGAYTGYEAALDQAARAILEEVPMFKIWTIEELAEDAFEKAERVRCLEMANTPVDYEERKQAFVAMAKARAAATEAEQRLIAVINGDDAADEAAPNDQAAL